MVSPKGNFDSSELRGLSKIELLKLARSKKLKVDDSIKKEELIRKLDGALKLSKLKKLVQPRASGIPLPLAKTKKKPAAAASKSKPAKAPSAAAKPAKKKRIALPIGKIRRRKKTAEKETPAPERVVSARRGGEEEIEEKKFYVSPSQPQPVSERREEELPQSYGRNRIVLLARDPEWIFTYWEVTPDRLAEAERFFGPEWGRTKTVLRVYDVTGIDFNGANAHTHFDIEVTNNARSWYIHANKPDTSFIVDIARVSPSGKFFTLARSNAVRTPRSRMSDVVDEEWMSIDFDKVYALSGGLRVGATSAELRRLVEKGLKIGMSSGSLGLSSQRKGKERKFWFVLDAELIVYGATEPDATVTMQGKPVQLRPDGTFTLRFSLPDGKQHIPATAVSADQIEERTITLDVNRKTTEQAPVLKEEAHA